MPIYTSSLLPNIATVSPAAFAAAAPSGLQVAPINIGPVLQSVGQAQQIQQQFFQQQQAIQQFQAQEAQRAFNVEQVNRKNQLQDIALNSKVADRLNIEVLAKDNEQYQRLKRQYNVSDTELEQAQDKSSMESFSGNVDKFLNDRQVKTMVGEKALFDKSFEAASLPKNRAFFGKNYDSYIENLSSFAANGTDATGTILDAHQILNPSNYFDNTSELEKHARLEQEAVNKYELQKHRQELADEKFLFEQAKQQRDAFEFDVKTQQVNDALKFKEEQQAQKIELENRKLDIKETAKTKKTTKTTGGGGASAPATEAAKVATLNESNFNTFFPDNAASKTYGKNTIIRLQDGRYEISNDSKSVTVSREQLINLINSKLTK